MVRLRDAVMAVALATGGVGCATFCDECDDFPMPGGPGGYSMMPGTYTGPPLTQASPDAGPVGPAPARRPAPRLGPGPSRPGRRLRRPAGGPRGDQAMTAARQPAVAAGRRTTAA